jgi:DNA-binding IclR family transcriptional regulator
MDLHSEFERLCRDPDLLPDQTLLLTVLDDTDVVYIGRRAGSRPIGVTYRLGMRLPANCTASGMALLSGLQPDEVRALYRGYPGDLPSLTPKSVNDLDALIERLAVVARLGYALDDEETLLGVTCLGAPIIDATGRAAGAVAVSLLKASLKPAEIDGAVSELCGLADRLSLALGGTPPQRSP